MYGTSSLVVGQLATLNSVCSTAMVRPQNLYLTGLSQIDPEYHFYQLAFGKRSEEELYDMQNDPDCVNNLAESSEHAAIRSKLWNQLRDELTAQGDPRILGQGDIFDFYPNCRVERQQKLYNKPDYDPVKIFESKYSAKKQTDSAHSHSLKGVALRESASVIEVVQKNRVLLAYNKLPPVRPAGIDPIFSRSAFIHRFRRLLVSR